MAGNSSEMTVIGRDTKIKGEMTFESGARILGTFEGKITSAGEVQVGEGANCLAAIDADRVVVDGNVNGDITAASVLTLNSEAKVEGDIVAGKLVVLEGATFVGNCRVGAGASKSGSTARTTSLNGSSSLGSSRSSLLRPTPELKPEPTVETRVSSVGALDAA